MSYSFDADADGPRIIKLKATSVESGNSDEGEARFEVGTVGYLVVLPPSLLSNTAEIRESGDDYFIVFSIRSAHPELDQQIRADVELDNLWTVYDARVDDDDRNFVLQAGESRNVTINIDVREENLENLAANIVDFNVSLVVISDLDTTKRTTQITLYKPDPIPEGTDVKEVGWLAANFALLAIGLAVMGVVLFSSFRVLQKARAPLEEHNSLSDYTMTVEGWSGEKIGADQLPSADEVANSMYGGSQDLFSSPSTIEPYGAGPCSGTRARCPPIPESGLPEGWTMEQWQYYGQQWLDSQKEE